MFPTSYEDHSHREKLILQLADNFHRQFNYLYPNRIRPPLYLKNECGVNKLMCTSLCPLKIKMPIEIKQVDSCASFFADFFDYEPFSSPLDCPETLSSVESILKRKKGNSLDLSTVLCTFLLASNYDAYVVQGYARRNICEKLVSEEEKPPMRFFTDSEYHKRFFTLVKGADENLTKNKFEVFKRADENLTKNKYEVNFELLKAFWMEGKSTFQPPKEPEPEPVRKPFEEDIYLGKRIHFWILIMFYEHGVLTPFFIEPTTGERKSIDDLDYLGIEFLWNDKNFWCNNRPLELSCKNVKFDLNDPAKWESFLPEYIMKECNNSIQMAETWVSDIEVTSEDLHNRFPENGRKIRYKMATVKKRNPGSSKNGLVYQMTYYKTEDKKEKDEKHAFFSKRKDFLEYRITDYNQKYINDVFALGRPDSLKEHKYPLEGISHFPQNLEFYRDFRKDLLFCRAWSDTKTFDEFSGRSDRLATREIDYFESSTKPEEQVQRYSSDSEDEERSDILGDIKETENKKEKEPEENFEEKESEEDLEEKVAASDTEMTVDSQETAESAMENGDTILSETDISEKEGAKISELSPTEVTPSSFDVDSKRFEEVDFNSWEFNDFLNRIDPAEKYATSESDSEDEKSKDVTEVLADGGRKNGENSAHKSPEIKDESKLPHRKEISRADDEQKAEKVTESGVQKIDGATEKLNPGAAAQASKDKAKSDIAGEDSRNENEINKATNNRHGIQDEKDDDDKIQEFGDQRNRQQWNEEKDIDSNTEGESDKEREIYDEINFDDLSDEELEVNYQLFLSKLWEDYRSINTKELFYMTREFFYYKYLDDRDVLKMKKNIMKKRRNRLKAKQRMESGKLDARIYKPKTGDIAKREEHLYTNGLVNSLGLKQNLGINNTDDLKEFHEIQELEEPYLDSVKNEIIKKESMLLLFKNLKANKVPQNTGGFKRIKSTYLRNASLPVEHDVENEIIDLETDRYRLDFHYPEGKISRKTLIFQKPESGSTAFRFSGVLFQQFLPGYETKPFQSSQMYSYTATLLKKEVFMVRDLEQNEARMKNILDTRKREEDEMHKRDTTEEKASRVLEKKSPRQDHQHDVKDVKIEQKPNEAGIISFAIAMLKLSLPLSEKDAKMVYLAVLKHFLEEAFTKFNSLEKEYKEATGCFEAILESRKNLNEPTNEEEKEMTQACGKFTARLSSIMFRCNAQIEATTTNFDNLKEKLSLDPRLGAFKGKARKNRNKKV